MWQIRRLPWTGALYLYRHQAAQCSGQALCGVLVGRLECSGELRRSNAGQPRRMNLLILGVGNQGHVAWKTAKAIDIFEEIAFQGDNRKWRGASQL